MRADEDAVGGCHPLFRVGEKARVRFDRVLEGGAVDLGGEGSDTGAGEDRRAHHQVVGKRGVDAPHFLPHRPHRRDVRLQVAVQLSLAELLEGLDLEAGVRVLDVDRQQTADIGVVDSHSLQLDLTVLAEQMDLVPEPGQRRSQVGVVDVAAGAAQHVAVEEENAHRCRPS
jgi:hypothetical protein